MVSNNVLATRTSLSYTSILPKLGPATPCEAPAPTPSTPAAQTCLGNRRFKQMEWEETQNPMEAVKTLLLLFMGCSATQGQKQNTSIKIQNCSYDRLRISEVVME